MQHRRHAGRHVGDFQADAYLAPEPGFRDSPRCADPDEQQVGVPMAKLAIQRTIKSIHHVRHQILKAALYSVPKAESQSSASRGTFSFTILR